MITLPPMKRVVIIVGIIGVAGAVIAGLVLFPRVPQSPLFVKSLTAESNLISVRLNLKGDSIAAATSLGELVRWDLASNGAVEPTDLIDFTDFTISAFSWMPDGSIVVGDTGRQLLSWELESDGVQSSRNLPGVVTAIGFRKSLAGAATLVTTTDGLLLSYEPKGIRKLEVNTSTTLKTLDVHPKGHLAVIGDADGRLHWIDLVSLKVESSQNAHDGEISVTAFSADGRRVLSADWNGVVQVRSVGKQKSVGQWKTEAAISCAAWAEDAVVVGTWDGDIHFWLPTYRTPYAVISADAAILGLDVQHEQNIVLSVSNKPRVDVWRIPKPN